MSLAALRSAEASATLMAGVFLVSILQADD